MSNFYSVPTYYYIVCTLETQNLHTYNSTFVQIMAILTSMPRCLTDTAEFYSANIQGTALFISTGNCHVLYICTYTRTQEAKYVERVPSTTPAWAGWSRFDIPVDRYGGVNSLLICTSSILGFLPVTRLDSRIILIEQNIKKRTGLALCVFCDQNCTVCTVDMCTEKCTVHKYRESYNTH
jgi:hypothetical protein